MVSAILLEILCCPETMQKVRPMTPGELQTSNRRISAGEMFTQSGTQRQEALTAGLIREDGQLVFPIADGIPVMLPEEALVLGGKNR